MKRVLVLLILVMACNTTQAQHYLTAGAGFGLMQFNSHDLDLFQKTYNQVNITSGQTILLRGFDLGIGLSGEFSYRHLGKWTQAVSFGYQQYTATDIAAFLNGVERDLKLTAHHFYVQPSFGLVKKYIFVEGLVTFFTSRQFKLNSNLLEGTAESPLSGVYRAKMSFAADAGIAVGGMSGPIMLYLKISHPIANNGDSEILTDPAASKVTDNLNAFPDDFVKYVARQPYKGVSSKIDGFKIMITLNYVLSLSPNAPER